MNDFRQRLARVLDAQFDPKWGAPYWLERAPTLGFDPRKDIKDLADLPRFGPMPVEELAKRPVTQFIPKRFHDVLHDFITAETGGTTGPPKRTAFRRDEFEDAFVAPFLQAATLMNFPKNVHWLFIGPSGPHVIGKAARACATAMGSIDPFMVDFDPRWARRLPPDSMARTRYVEHVLDQTLAILETQEIGVIFATPPILTSLAEGLEASIRATITGIHVGGMPANPSFWKQLTTQWFPNAVALSGYGNSLAGMCPQLHANAEAPPEYFPYGPRLTLQVQSPGDAGRGQVFFHRLDESGFLPNVYERDEAAVAPPPQIAKGTPFQSPGLQDPRPPSKATEAQAPGLY